MTSRPPQDLQRFVDAQHPVYDRVVQELRSGRKVSHWMWFVFPQLVGLGLSDMSRRYAITSLAEAQSYLEHPVLGERLRACTRSILTHAGTPAAAIFGSIDALKLRSSLTLFAIAGEPDDPFVACLEAFFGGVRDEATLHQLQELVGRSPRT